MAERQFRIPRSLIAMSLVFIGSCAHTPSRDAHQHAAVPALALDSPLIVQGRVVDAESGQPIPYATVYLIDLRPACWSKLRRHSARLGTSDGSGEIDVSASWSTKGEVNIDSMPLGALDWVRNVNSLADKAEERCRADNPVNAAIIVEAPTHFGQYVLLNSSQWVPGPGERVLQLGDWTLRPIPEGYWCHDELTEADVDLALAPGENP